MMCPGWTQCREIISHHWLFTAANLSKVNPFINCYRLDNNCLWALLPLLSSTGKWEWQNKLSEIRNLVSLVFGLRQWNSASCVFHINPEETGDLCMTGPPYSLWIRASSMARMPPVNTACVICESWKSPSSGPEVMERELQTDFGLVC